MSTYWNTATAAVPTTLTNAAYQAWITEFKTALTATDWSRTSDTGQLDETTVTLPGALSTYSGYHVYYLNDSLHSTFPLYMKISWGIGSVANRLVWKFQFGYATNGAGAFTGWSSSEYIYADTGSGSTGSCMASSATGFRFFSFNYGQGTTASTTNFFIVHRRFSSGSAASSGDWGIILRDRAGYGVNITYGFERSTGRVLSLGKNICMPIGDATASSGSELELYRHFNRTGSLSGTGGSCTYFLSEVPTGTTFTANVYGVSHTWLATGLTGLSASASINVQQHSLAVVWE